MSVQQAGQAEDDATLLVELRNLLVSSLGLAPSAVPACPETRLLGVLPELDSMSVVGFLLGIEEHYDIVVHDDEVDAEIFETLGNLAAFVGGKLA